MGCHVTRIVLQILKNLPEGWNPSHLDLQKLSQFVIQIQINIITNLQFIVHFYNHGA